MGDETRAAGELQPGQTRFMVGEDVRAKTESFLRDRGRGRHEAVAAWIGRLVDDGEAVIDQVYVPEQHPLEDDEGGVGVYISGEAITRLILALENDDRVLARVHSHPGFAYHSETDDLNRLISHAGAISVVVPYFASQGLRFETCSVNELMPRVGWSELSIDEVMRRFEIR